MRQRHSARGAGAPCPTYGCPWNHRSCSSNYLNAFFIIKTILRSKAPRTHLKTEASHLQATVSKGRNPYFFPYISDCWIWSENKNFRNINEDTFFHKSKTKKLVWYGGWNSKFFFFFLKIYFFFSAAKGRTKLRHSTML